MTIEQRTEKNKAFVEEYCKKKDWEPRMLTISQVHEIMLQDEWISDPKAENK